MIKRRFYRFEHGDKDAPSESSSSSSDSEVEAEATDETEVEEEEQEEENVVLDDRHRADASSSSGYESEDSSANEVNLDSSGLPTSDDDEVAQNGGQNTVATFARSEDNNAISQHSPEKDESSFDVKDCVIKCKSVFKCRLCPRIVCLSEETLKAHLNSKRHARSEKLHREGRLKLMLNSEGQIEGETHPDSHDTTTVSGQSPTKSKKKGKGRWKQRKRPKQEMKPDKARQSAEKQWKRQKNG